MDTIFALSTPYTKSGVAIFRISGPKALAILPCLGVNDVIKPRYAYYRSLINVNKDETVDNALILYFPTPASFTGEDVIEIHIHGSMAVIKELNQILTAIPDFRQAVAGEFARRAFLNGKMDLTKIEALGDLIDSETNQQKKQALRLMKGEFGVLTETWRKNIITILALIEAFIDFPDEEIPQDLLDEVNIKVADLKLALTTHLADNNRGQILKDGFQIAILGAPNVGKSSLLNYLAASDVAITSHIPGTTRDIIEINLDIGGFPVVIADTAGLRQTEDIIENIGVQRAKSRADSVDLKLILLSSDNLNNNETIELIDSNSIVIINKIDLTTPDPEITIQGHKPIFISVINKLGLDILFQAITKHLQNFFDSGPPPLITRDRHRKTLQNSLECLDSFDLSKPLELAAEDLRMAARNLGYISGKIEVDEILDEIFSSFCIGK